MEISWLILQMKKTHIMELLAGKFARKTNWRCNSNAGGAVTSAIIRKATNSYNQSCLMNSSWKVPHPQNIAHSTTVNAKTIVKDETWDENITKWERNQHEQKHKKLQSFEMPKFIRLNSTRKVSCCSHYFIVKMQCTYTVDVRIQPAPNSTFFMQASFHMPFLQRHLLRLMQWMWFTLYRWHWKIFKGEV